MDLIKLKITGGGDMTRHKEMLEDKQIELMKGIKSVFDPKKILNPGKLF